MTYKQGIFYCCEYCNGVNLVLSEVQEHEKGCEER